MLLTSNFPFYLGLGCGLGRDYEFGLGLRARLGKLGLMQTQGLGMVNTRPGPSELHTYWEVLRAAEGDIHLQ